MRAPRIATTLTALAAVLLACLPARAATYTWTGDSGLSNSWYSPGNWGASPRPTSLPATTSSRRRDGIRRKRRSPSTADTSRWTSDTLTFDQYATTPLTIQIGATNDLFWTRRPAGPQRFPWPQRRHPDHRRKRMGPIGAGPAMGRGWHVADQRRHLERHRDPSPGFAKSGVGTLILSGANSFGGPITVTQGVLSVASIANQGQPCNLGRGTLTLDGGTLDYTGASGTTSRGFVLGTAAARLPCKTRRRRSLSAAR